MFEFSDPIRSICLDPRYETTKAFCVGVGKSKCIINRKGWFGNTSTIVHQGEGLVSKIAWNVDNLLAWSTERSVKIYDTEKEVRISSLDRPKTETSPQCYVVWESANHLLVGWSDTIKIIRISRRRLASGKSESYAEIVGMFRTPYYICGVAPWGKKSMAVLAMSRDDDDDENEEEEEEEDDDDDGVDLPELHIISRDSGEELSSDLLELRGFEHYNKSDYSLHHSSSSSNGNILYVVTAKDVVLAKARNLTDRVRWLLKRNRFETILSVLQSCSVDEDVRYCSLSLSLSLNIQEAHEKIIHTHTQQVPSNLKSQFAESYMSALVSSKNWSLAASLCSDLISYSSSPPPPPPSSKSSSSSTENQSQLWEKYISIFAKHRNLDKIAIYVPTSSPRLPKYVYEMILNEYLASSNIEGLLMILRRWTATDKAEEEEKDDLFDLQKVILKTRQMLKTVKIVDEKTKHRAVLLSEALAMLYRAAGEHKNALRVHLTSPEPPAVPRDVFAMLETHDLLDGDSLEANVGPLLRLDTEETLRLMIRNLDKIPIERAVRHLSHDSEIQMKYLHILFQTKRHIYNGTSSYGKFHEMQIRLYVKHRPDLLLPFLQTSRHYSLSEALEMCTSHDPPLTCETAYVLKRMGKSKDAVKLLVEDGNVRVCVCVFIK